MHVAFTGDHAGKLAIYDLERPEVALYSQQAHTSIINAIDGCGGMDIGNGAPEIVTGKRRHCCCCCCCVALQGAACLCAVCAFLQGPRH
jgi:hypothetical protein